MEDFTVTFGFLSKEVIESKKHGTLLSNSEEIIVQLSVVLGRKILFTLRSSGIYLLNENREVLNESGQELSSAPNSTKAVRSAASIPYLRSPRRTHL